TFAHDKIRDVVYTEAGVTRRRLYHRRVFSLLEAGLRQAQRAQTQPAAELAFHAVAARLNDEAFRYSMAAGDEALRLNAFVEAAGHYDRALEYLEEVESTAAERRTLYTQRGRSLELCGHYALALENYAAMSAAARRYDDPALGLAALVAEGTIRATANEYSDFVLGEELGEKALELARELDDKTAEARIQWNMLNVYRMTGRNEEALEAGQRSLALAEELGLREEMAYAANDLVYIYMALGEVAPVLALGERAIALWRELGNLPMLSDSLINYANMQAMSGEYEQALAIAGEALAISRTLENHWAHSFSLYTFSMVYKQTMQVDEALSAMQESLRLGHAAGFTGAQVLVRVFEAELRLALGDTAGARGLAEKAVDIAGKSIPLFWPTAQGVLAQTAVAEGRLDEAGQILQSVERERYQPNLMGFLTMETAVCRYALACGKFAEAYAYSSQVLAFLDAQKLRMYVADFLYFQGQALVDLQRAHEARTVLARALAVLRETAGRRGFVDTAMLLAELEEQVGNSETAEGIREEAREVGEFVEGRVLVDQVGE
ncbi:MAG: tetratricopeptide repeat protein, partial [Candidatus Promineifilaceae bacterium]|nr:tetratricopeptide repeat protein [Candidatus Promineifilaceae bacterium]